MIRPSVTSGFCAALIAGLAAASPVRAALNPCGTCGAPCPAGWTQCQRCKNEADRIAREEGRRRRLAEQEELRRRRQTEQEEARLRKLIEVDPDRAVGMARGGKAPLQGLFGVKFSDTVGSARFTKRDDPGGSYSFTPAKRFRSFAEYTVEAESATGKVISISTRRVFSSGNAAGAKRAAIAELDACCALLKRKFGLELEQQEDSEACRSMVMKFTSPGGVAMRVVSVSLVREIVDAVFERDLENPDAGKSDPEIAYTLTITAEDRVSAYRERLAKERERSARESDDLDAL